MFKLKENNVIQVTAIPDQIIPTYWEERRWKIIKVMDNKILVQGYDRYGNHLTQEKHFLLKDYAIERCRIRVLVDPRWRAITLRNICGGKDIGK